MINPAPYNAEAPPAALAGDITPTELHYVRSNFAVPDARRHPGDRRRGRTRPPTLTLDDLRAMPASSTRSPSSAPATAAWRCGRCRPASPGATTRSPPRAGPARSCTRSWRRRARAADGVDVRFEGADHGAYHLQPILPETDRDDLTFVRALPLAQATDPAAEILIAYEMNGQPLGRDHGAPFRLVVPHWYAVASVKWLTRIDVLTEPYTGEFQTGHYMYQWPDRPHEPVDLMRVRARITDPAPGSVIDAGTCTVRGKAWSGTGPITRVEVSLTGEGDWHQAQLEPPRGPYHWQDWSFTWDATDVGRHTLRARATDAAGNVQPDVPPWNRLGYGNNAIEVIYVDVR